MKLCLSLLVAGCLLLGACARPIPPLSLESPLHVMGYAHGSSLEDFLANGDQYCSVTPFRKKKETLQLRKSYASTAEDTAVYRCIGWKEYPKDHLLHGVDWFGRLKTTHDAYFHEGKLIRYEAAPERPHRGGTMGVDLLIETLLK